VSAGVEAAISLARLQRQDLAAVAAARRDRLVDVLEDAGNDIGSRFA
jgi:hypothetical protein